MTINRRRLLALAPLFAAASLAQAEDRALPEALDRALAEAEAQGRLVLSFSMRFRWRSAPPVVARFDAANGRWRVLSGDPNALGPEGRRKFESYKRQESAPGGLVAGDYRAHLADVEALGSDGDKDVFSFTAREARTAPAAAAVGGRLHVDRAHGGLALYRLEALRPFKPAPATRLDEFLFEHRFERSLDGAPPLLVKARVKASGRRVLARINEDYEADFFDFARAPE